MPVEKINQFVKRQIKHHAVYPPGMTALVMVPVGILSLLFAIVCIWLGFDPPRSLAWDYWKRVIIAIWIVGPPTWLFIDYFFLYKRWGLDNSFPSFKHGQEVVAKFWIGVSTLLSGLYFGNEVLQKLNPPGRP